MEYLTLQNGVQMPLVGFGTFMLSGETCVKAVNEIPDEIDGEDNLDNEPAQIPNRRAVDVVETSGLNYTILRPGYLGEGDEDDFVLTVKGESAKGYTTPIPALIKFAVQLILDDRLYSRKSVSITHDAARK